jgi:hypothetical protein
MNATPALRCSEMVYPGVQCILPMRHEGPHRTAIIGPGTVCICPICERRFPSIAEFDAHAPCEDAE